MVFEMIEKFDNAQETQAQVPMPTAASPFSAAMMPEEMMEDHMGRAAQPPSPPARIEWRAPSELSPHPLNARLYGEGVDGALRDSIKENGIIDPLLITAANVIISGHRRHAAAVVLQLKKVPVLVYNLTDEAEIELAVITANAQRERTNVMKARECRELNRIETERAKHRQQQSAVNTNAKLGRSTDAETVGETIPESSGRARDIAAQHVGWSGKTAEKAIKVIDAIDASDDETAKEIRKALSGSVNRGYRVAVQKGRIEASPTSSADSKFNCTNESVDWARWTWNPVTGCQHTCTYCYARDMATRFSAQYISGTPIEEADTAPFAPRLHEARLAAPANTELPAISDDPWARTVFVCSMADLFGAWVPQDWIDRVLAAVRAEPQWTFIFLTKNPARLTTIDWPANAWVGTTVDTQARVAAAEAAFASVNARVKFVSCEPLLEPVQFTRLDLFNWLIIGGRSKTTSGTEAQPEWAWVHALLQQANEAQCSVYCKPNLRPTFPKGLPAGWPAPAPIAEPYTTEGDI